MSRYYEVFNESGDFMATKATTKKRSKPAGSVKAFADAAECLKTLAHPVRLRIVQLLLHGRYTVGELAEDCETPDNVASEHLRLLQRCGFLTSERDGRRVFYQVAEPHLKQLMACVEGRFLNGKGKKR
jgi:DNA-binding transcriptional ArsR family regulator